MTPRLPGTTKSANTVQKLEENKQDGRDKISNVSNQQLSGFQTQLQPANPLLCLRCSHLDI